MKANPDFSVLCESFFAKRLMAQRKASEALLGATDKKTWLGRRVNRTNGARSRNARLAAIRSFYHYAALEAPQHSGE